MKTFYWIVVTIVVLLMIFFGWFFVSKNNYKQAEVFGDPNLLAGIQEGNYPWPPELNNLKTRLSQIGLPALTQEGSTLHTHQHLDILINGKQVEIPSEIGKNDSAGFISPIHTHDTTGIIHVESPFVAKFYLGQFFDIWGVHFDSNCIGSYCQAKDENLKVFLNGNLVSGDPRKIELQAHQEIVVAFGTISQMPFPVPSSYNFPAGS